MGIARAVVSKPDILLADEPTGNLDQAMSDEIMDLFYDFHLNGTTVIIATHDQRYLQNPKAGLLRLQGGQLIEDSRADLLPEDGPNGEPGNELGGEIGDELGSEPDDKLEDGLGRAGLGQTPDSAPISSTMPSEPTLEPSPDSPPSGTLSA